MKRIPYLLLLISMFCTAQENLSIDPMWMYSAEQFHGDVPALTEQVPGSDITNHIYFIELRDGVYAPVGVRKPEGNGPFPVIFFAHMNGGLGLQWIREWTNNGSWTLEQFIESGYAVVWMRYRAEVENSYGSNLEEGTWQGRQIFSRGPFEYEDAMDIMSKVSSFDFIDDERIGYVGVSHGGEMLMKIATESSMVKAGIAAEPASIEYLAKRSDPSTNGGDEETYKKNSEEMQRQAILKLRNQIDHELAASRIEQINTSIFVMGRDRDHNQDIFRLNYELLEEAGKDVTWKSYDHPDHSFLFVTRNHQGEYVPDELQLQAINDAIDYFNQQLN